MRAPPRLPQFRGKLKRWLATHVEHVAVAVLARAGNTHGGRAHRDSLGKRTKPRNLRDCDNLPDCERAGLLVEILTGNGSAELDCVIRPKLRLTALQNHA